MKKHDVYRYLINFLYPNRCPGCDCVIDYNCAFCEKCGAALIPYDKKFNVENADAFEAYCVYEGIAQKAVLNFKHTAQGNAYYAFAWAIFQKLRQSGLDKGINVITYVPMLYEDIKVRGYNQSELIAKELHFMLNVPCRNALVKTKKTLSQKSLSGDERRINVMGVFAANKRFSVSGSTVLLVDDVCTTGSTLSEAAGVLRKAGASRVIAAAFAKTERVSDNQ